MSALFDNYLVLANGKSCETAPLPVSYSRYAAWQREVLAGERESKETQWWKSCLSDFPDLDLPVDFPRPQAQNFTGEALHFNFSTAETSALDKIGKEAGATQYAVWMSLYSLDSIVTR